MCAAPCPCCRARWNNLGRSRRAVNNCSFTSKFSPELSFDRGWKTWERSVARQDVHCPSVEQFVVFPLKTSTCSALTRKDLSYSQSYPVFVGKKPAADSPRAAKSARFEHFFGVGVHRAPVCDPVARQVHPTPTSFAARVERTWRHHAAPVCSAADAATSRGTQDKFNVFFRALYL